MLWAIVCESVCASSSGHSQSISGAPKRTSKSLGLTLCECGVQLHAFDANTVRSLSLSLVSGLRAPHREREAATVKRRKNIYSFHAHKQEGAFTRSLIAVGGCLRKGACVKNSRREKMLSAFYASVYIRSFGISHTPGSGTATEREQIRI
jgi:hypothetical protein